MTTRHLRRVRLRIDTRHCALRRGELESIEEGVGLLEAETSPFSFADLAVTISYRPRSGEYHVRTRLALPGRVVFTGEHDTVALPAYERCLRKLVRKIERHREHLNRSRTNGKHNRPTDEQDSLSTDEHRTNRERLKQACDEDDYGLFRKEMLVYEDLIRERVGGWVRRYSDAESAQGGREAFPEEALPFDDLVEEVLLTAFVRYPAKPRAMRLEDWLESLIDPAMRSLLRHPDEELEAIGFARTLQEMHDDHGADDAEGAFFESAGGDEPSPGGDLFRRP